jgi:acetyltransferase
MERLESSMAGLRYLPCIAACGGLPLPDGTALSIRPARADDGPLLQALVRQLSVTSRYRRFFYPLHELAPDLLARSLHADPLHELALLAVIRENGEEVAIGMAQYVADADSCSCEFGIVVADAWQRQGIGRRLLQNLIRIARAAGIRRIEGETLAENEPMRRLLLAMGFALGAHGEGAYLRRTWKDLGAPSPCPLPLAGEGSQPQYSTATPFTPNCSTSICLSESAGDTRHSSASRISQPAPCPV